MTVLTEKRHAGGYLVSEANGMRSREVGTITGGNYEAGTVLGKIGPSTGAPTYTADAGNTGNFTCSAVTEGAGAKVGDYHGEFLAATEYLLTDPDGLQLAPGNTGVAYSHGGLGFTLTAGATVAVAGDGFKITVAANAKVGCYTQHDPVAKNGAEVAAAILFDATDASMADRKQTITARDTEVNASELVWKTGVTTLQKTAALAQLAEHGIIGR
jgi:hypothetical protein